MVIMIHDKISFQIIVSVFLAKLNNAQTRKEKGEIKAGIS